MVWKACVLVAAISILPKARNSYSIGSVLLLTRGFFPRQIKDVEIKKIDPNTFDADYKVLLA